MSKPDPVAAAVSKYGAAATAKLNNLAIKGEPEEQLRGPLETLVADLNAVIGEAARGVVTVGETKVKELMIRPDFAVTRERKSGEVALIGFIEVKAPGKGADPTKFPAKSHDRSQWDRLKSLPNLIYTDGNDFSLWRDGKRIKTAELTGDVRTDGKAVAGGADLLDLLTQFYDWRPIPPRSPRQLAETTARLCRLLRDEVTEQLDRKAPGLTGLAEDWRKLLFPHADATEFADGYAQAVTFGLLMARARNISLEGGIEPAAKALSKSDSLIGSALRLLTEDADEEHALDTSLRTLSSVLEVVDWSQISKGDPEAWLYFYELFLQQYDTALRKKTGSYYTPPEVVAAMVRLVDEALQSPSRFGLPRGLASPEVTVADPAVGTGTFLLGVLRRIADRVAADEGEGSVPTAISDALKRLIGFELQFGPFAVAQLRLLAEVVDLTEVEGEAADASQLRVYVADTLADPDEETAWITTTRARVIAKSRSDANAIKRKEAITVVLGNPPYKEKAKGLGGWVEQRGPGLRSPLDDWQPPAAWGVGAHAKHLRNLYVYFWRWAAWKVFGGDPYRSGDDKAEAVWTERRGVVCFITVAGFLNGPGFQKMRADLRRDADEIWVVDCSPEGHQPPVASRVFEDVQQPVCIVLAIRRSAATNANTPARVRFRSLPEGDRRKVKFPALAAMSLDDAGWEIAPSEWRASFLPASTTNWASYPSLESLFSYNGSGVMAGRTWVIAPDADTLRKRWTRLITEKDPAKKADMFVPHLRDDKPADKHVDKTVKEGLAGHPHRAFPVSADQGPAIEPVRYGFNSFNRQWIIPDPRLINQPNPGLWRAYSDKQVFLTALRSTAPLGGPALTFTALLPEINHYKGSAGGRVLPLWADAGGKTPNLPPRLLAEISAAYGRPVTAEDVFAYIAALAASPAYTARFQRNLKQPGLRIPITADPALFAEAVALGSMAPHLRRALSRRLPAG